MERGSGLRLLLLCASERLANGNRLARVGKRRAHAQPKKPSSLRARARASTASTHRVKPAILLLQF